MKLPSLFRRTPAPDVSQAARELARQGVERRKAKIRATCEAMNRNAGRPLPVWPS